ncbi:hypothetical protein GCM10022265_24190 [Marinobacter xestospongiae]
MMAPVRQIVNAEDRPNAIRQHPFPSLIQSIVINHQQIGTCLATGRSQVIQGSLRIVLPSYPQPRFMSASAFQIIAGLGSTQRLCDCFAGWRRETVNIKSPTTDPIDKMPPVKPGDETALPALRGKRLCQGQAAHHMAAAHDNGSIRPKHSTALTQASPRIRRQ